MRKVLGDIQNWWQLYVLEHQRQYEAILSHFLWSKFGSFLTIKIGSKNEDNAQLKMPAALSKSMVQKL